MLSGWAKSHCPLLLLRRVHQLLCAWIIQIADGIANKITKFRQSNYVSVWVTVVSGTFSTLPREGMETVFAYETRGVQKCHPRGGSSGEWELWINKTLAVHFKSPAAIDRSDCSFKVKLKWVCKSNYQCKSFNLPFVFPPPSKSEVCLFSWFCVYRFQFVVFKVNF